MSTGADSSTAPSLSSGPEYLNDATPVLLHRELLPGTDRDELCRFGEDRWHVNEGIFEQDASAYSFNFAAVPEPLRGFAKYYFWQVINCDSPSPLRRTAIERPSLRTVANMWVPFKAFVDWLHDRAVTKVSQVTAEMLDDYLIDVGNLDVALGLKYRRVVEIRRLWSYRLLLPEHMRLPTMPPWGGDPARELLGASRAHRENLTPRINEDTMKPLLWWSLRFVEDFAEDILAAHREYLFLYFRGRQAGQGVANRAPNGQVLQRARRHIDQLHRDDGSLPGRHGADGFLRIDWRHLTKVLDYTSETSLRDGSAGKLLLDSGLPIADDAYLDTPVTGLVDGSPWHHGPFRYHQIRHMARHLSTACLIVIAYLSGARPGEVLNLRRGCIEHDVTNDMWLMRGVFFKNAVDTDGNKIPAGMERRDPWVVIKPVATAVAILERLHHHPLLFPNSIEAHRQLKNTRRKGQARVPSRCADDIAAFIEWANMRGASVAIPIDSAGPLNITRFRRTLAWFIRRQPRGLVAGSIQYGHVHTRLMQGYAGDYDSGFVDELAFEDFLARLDQLADDEKALQTGETVSGPAAQEYRHRVTAAGRQFAGHVLTSNRQARDLLTNPALQIYHGDAMTCVFDARVAACQLRGTADDPAVTPDLEDCRPWCRNIARTDRDIAELSTRRTDLALIVGDPLAPPIRHRRDQLELQRIDTILEGHDDASHSSE